MRIGFGYDLHRLVKNRELILGGVKIPFSLGEAGHSDGDVLIHSIIDALLGAGCLGDIGRHFPPGNKEFKDIESRILLRKTFDIVKNAGFLVSNLDTTIVLEKPKLLSYIPEIRKNISTDLKISVDCVSVKAKTKEGAGAVGRSEAVEAYATVLLILQGT